MTAVFLLACVGIAAGWLWCSPDAHVLDWPRDRVNRAIDVGIASDRRSTRSIALWFHELTSCPVCVGFWPTLAVHALIDGLSLESIPIMATTLVIHLAWQTLLRLTLR